MKENNFTVLNYLTPWEEKQGGIGCQVGETRLVEDVLAKQFQILVKNRS